MHSLANVLSPVIGLMVGAAIWVILFTVILEALKKASPFTGWTCYVLAASVSLLSVISMFRFLGGSDVPARRLEDDGIPWFVLLPYAAMGIAMLVMLLFLFVGKLSRKSTPRPLRSESQRLRILEQEEASKCPALPDHRGRDKQD